MPLLLFVCIYCLIWLEAYGGSPESERWDWSTKDVRSVSAFASSALLIFANLLPCIFNSLLTSNLQSSQFRPFFFSVSACRHQSVDETSVDLRWELFIFHIKALRESEEDKVIKIEIALWSVKGQIKNVNRDIGTK